MDLNPKKKVESDWGPVIWIASMGINLVLSSAVGLAIGYYLDKWLKTTPILLIVFFAIGTFAGFYQIYKDIKRLEK